MSFHDVLRVWTHGTTLEIGSLAVHVGLHEVYRLSCGHEFRFRDVSLLLVM